MTCFEHVDFDAHVAFGTEQTAFMKEDRAKIWGRNMTPRSMVSLVIYTIGAVRGRAARGRPSISL